MIEEKDCIIREAIDVNWKNGIFQEAHIVPHENANVELLRDKFISDPNGFTTEKSYKLCKKNPNEPASALLVEKSNTIKDLKTMKTNQNVIKW